MLIFCEIKTDRSNGIKLLLLSAYHWEYSFQHSNSTLITSFECHRNDTGFHSNKERFHSVETAHWEAVCNVWPFQKQFFFTVTNPISQITHDTSEWSDFQLWLLTRNNFHFLSMSALKPVEPEREEKALGKRGFLGFRGHVYIECKPVLKSIINSEIIYLVLACMENVETNHMISA